MNILIIDDEKECGDALEFYISKLGNYNITKSYDGIEGLNLIKKKNYDLVFSDVDMPNIDGIEFTKIAKHRNKNIEIVLVSGKKNIIDSINAIEYGALDFLTKPADGEKISEIINKIDQKNKNKSKNKKSELIDVTKLPDDEIIKLNDFNIQNNNIYYNKDIGRVGIFSDVMKNIYNKLKKLHEFPEIPILIEGRTGTGKEIIARYIHFESSRSKEPFVALNCAAINKDIFESELFGYEKGAFTGSNPNGNEGKIKLAENGTLFLDEITEMPIDMQSKILRVLQEKEYYKISGNIKQKVNTRIICATNSNIKTHVKNKLFREDLYYRLNVCKINIPSLSKRKEEITPLTFLFLKEINKLNKIKIIGLEAKILKLLLEHNWPGNIRELKNVIVKMILFNENEILKAENFKILHKSKNNKNIKFDPDNVDLPGAPFSLEIFNKKIIEETLKKFNGNKTMAAKFLGLNRKQLYNRYKTK